MLHIYPVTPIGATNKTANPSAKKPRPVDLGGDNELPGLLAERERLAALAKQAEADLAKIKARIAEKLGDAPAAKLPGWRLRRVVRHRAAYVVPAQSYSFVECERVPFDFS